MSTLQRFKKQLVKEAVVTRKMLSRLPEVKYYWKPHAKDGMISMTICQTTPHRAQWGVYLRLLDIPIPGSYGPSADEPEFN